MREIPSKMVPLLRARLKKITAANENQPVEKERRLQDLTAEVMERLVRGSFKEERIDLGGFEAAMITPVRRKGAGAVLYLHGGGYCCGNLDYARWFGKVLAGLTGTPVLCPAYRLAPEHPYPAALDDAEAAYRRLLRSYPCEKTVIIGESAGGGLCFALCQKLRAEGELLPAGLVAISPWVDLTQSGDSYRRNAAADPSMTKARLDKFAAAYTRDPADPGCSPLFGEAAGLPETRIFAGGDEVLCDDAVRMYHKLKAAGVQSRLVIAPGMWHAYPFYGLRERHRDMVAISAFIREKTK